MVSSMDGEQRFREKLDHEIQEAVTRALRDSNPFQKHEPTSRIFSPETSSQARTIASTANSITPRGYPALPPGARVSTLPPTSVESVHKRSPSAAFRLLAGLGSTASSINETSSDEAQDTRDLAIRTLKERCQVIEHQLKVTEGDLESIRDELKSALLEIPSLAIESYQQVNKPTSKVTAHDYESNDFDKKYEEGASRRGEGLANAKWTDGQVTPNLIIRHEAHTNSITADMKPLLDIGVATRLRFLEQARDGVTIFGYGTPDMSVVQKGKEAAYSANGLADLAIIQKGLYSGSRSQYEKLFAAVYEQTPGYYASVNRIMQRLADAQGTLNTRKRIHQEDIPSLTQYEEFKVLRVEIMEHWGMGPKHLEKRNQAMMEDPKFEVIVSKMEKLVREIVALESQTDLSVIATNNNEGDITGRIQPAKLNAPASAANASWVSAITWDTLNRGERTNGAKSVPEHADRSVPILSHGHSVWSPQPIQQRASVAPQWGPPVQFNTNNKSKSQPYPQSYQEDTTEQSLMTGEATSARFYKVKASKEENFRAVSPQQKQAESAWGTWGTWAASDIEW